ncbi:hypothetical protein P7K49_016369 [Saguinus oedipus]|uniref:Uncharacterized protein n=1 Tax=Saguinus oedipus TaxID=9490 RepID=A0ABQ9VCG2_SAGOE|nr:hypothetical protein P7K49_016369 [Saguinus oedipus]
MGKYLDSVSVAAAFVAVFETEVGELSNDSTLCCLMFFSSHLNLQAYDGISGIPLSLCAKENANMLIHNDAWLSVTYMENSGALKFVGLLSEDLWDFRNSWILEKRPSWLNSLENRAHGPPRGVRRLSVVPVITALLHMENLFCCEIFQAATHIKTSLFAQHLKLEKTQAPSGETENLRNLRQGRRVGSSQNLLSLTQKTGFCTREWKNSVYIYDVRVNNTPGSTSPRENRAASYEDNQ